MPNHSIDSFSVHKTLVVADNTYHYYCLREAEKHLNHISRLPFSLKVLLENQLRHEDGITTTIDNIKLFDSWMAKQQTKVNPEQSAKQQSQEIGFRPARVLLQDFTGVPAVVDLAAMRDATKSLGQDPEKINPLLPVDLVIDHSVQVDYSSSSQAFEKNVAIEMTRNDERYEFLHWGKGALANLSIVPPGTGICHQVNLEYLAKTVWQQTIDGQIFAYPDSLVGTDSHTTMINALGVLGWGVGGIEAEAAMLGESISMLIPEVVGVHITGKLTEGVTATDLVLTLTQRLRQHGVVGKFVEYYGSGLGQLSLPDRATIANMSPEYGATCGFFPVDQVTLDYLTLSGRSSDTIELVKAYSIAQGLWREDDALPPVFSSTIHLDLSEVEPSLAGPKRPQDRVSLKDIPQLFADMGKDSALSFDTSTITDHGFSISHGDIVIAAITSCTNTSNPDVMITAGLIAKKAVEKGLDCKPWVKRSLAPGSKVVSEYLAKTGLQPYLDQLGFHVVGYGCTTCIGNSGPLAKEISTAITENDLMVCAVLSGNRNFEGRIHPLTKANWLGSPPLVVAYALAGSIKVNLTTEPLAIDANGNPVYLKDLWPSRDEINDALAKVTADMFKEQYADVFNGNEQWNALESNHDDKTYQWQADSTYIRLPPFFTGLTKSLPEKQDINQANILALLGDSVTTDHISPAGAIKPDSPAGKYLQGEQVAIDDFNSYGSRRGNHEVLLRGTLANIRIRNEMIPGIEGGFTKYLPEDQIMPIFDAAMKYQQNNTDLVIIAGKEYGTGSSRDWAAKGTLLLGVKAVIAESFERIHRSNLIGMGVLPLQFQANETRKTLALTGAEVITIKGIKNSQLKPKTLLPVTIYYPSGETKTTEVICRIDTEKELNYYLHGGILHYVLRKMQNN